MNRSIQAMVMILFLFAGAMAAMVASSKHAEQLEQLDPVDSQAYFELAEDIASTAQTREDKKLAITLFALADHLDPKRWRRSSILAIEELVDDPNERRLLESNLQAWTDEIDFLPVNGQVTREDDEIVLAAVVALSSFRQGDSKEFRRQLAKSGVRERLDAVSDGLPGNTEWMLQRLSSQGDGPGSLSDDEIIAMLEVQGALLRTQHRPWSVVLQARRGIPMTVEDPISLAEIFGVNPLQSRYRNGRWE